MSDRLTECKTRASALDALRRATLVMANVTFGDGHRLMSVSKDDCYRAVAGVQDHMTPSDFGMKTGYFILFNEDRAIAYVGA